MNIKSQGVLLKYSQFTTQELKNNETGTGGKQDQSPLSKRQPILGVSFQARKIAEQIWKDEEMREKISRRIFPVWTIYSMKMRNLGTYKSWIIQELMAIAGVLVVFFLFSEIISLDMIKQASGTSSYVAFATQGLLFEITIFSALRRLPSVLIQDLVQGTAKMIDMSRATWSSYALAHLLIGFTASTFSFVGGILMWLILGGSLDALGGIKGVVGLWLLAFAVYISLSSTAVLSVTASVWAKKDMHLGFFAEMILKTLGGAVYPLILLPFPLFELALYFPNARMLWELRLVHVGRIAFSTFLTHLFYFVGIGCILLMGALWLFDKVVFLIHKRDGLGYY